MKFRAFLLEMAESEIMDMVSTAQYSRIKMADPNPVFRAYIVGHEGKSQGTISTAGQKLGSIVKKWYKSAIQNFHDKINIGLKLFHGHSDSNIGRVSIGEVVGKALKTINDKLSVVIAAYIEPQFRNLPLDIASIEADIWLSDDGGEYVADVEKISGIALGSSKIEKPGFAGATLLGQIQAFVAKSQFSEGRENMENITINDVKRFIETEKVKPGDLFATADLSNDPSVKGIIEAERTEAVKGEYAHRKRTDEEFKKQSETWDKEKKKLEDEITKLKPMAAKNIISDSFETMKKKRELDDREIKFIEKRISKFVPKNVDDVEKELDSFVDDVIDEFAEIRKDVFGEEKAGNDNGGGGEAKGENDQKNQITGPRKGDPNAKNEYDTNPLIPD